MQPSGPNGQNADARQTAILQRTPREVAADLQAGAPLALLDVREAWEVALASIPGAVHVPLGTLRAVPDCVTEAIPVGTPIVVYCHHGMRSQRGAALLQAAGIGPVANLAGGIDAWSTDVDPSVARY